MTKEEALKKHLMIRAINDQMDRYEQEKGPMSASSYNGEYLPQGRSNYLNENIIVPAILNEFQSPDDYIIESERYLEANPERKNYAPEVRDPITMEEILRPKRKS